MRAQAFMESTLKYHPVGLRILTLDHIKIWFEDTVWWVV